MKMEFKNAPRKRYTVLSAHGQDFNSISLFKHFLKSGYITKLMIEPNKEASRFAQTSLLHSQHSGCKWARAKEKA